MSQDATTGRHGGGIDLGVLLLGSTRLTPEQLEVARQRQGETGQRLLDVLIEQDVLPEEELLAALGARLGLPVLHAIPADSVDDALVARVPIAFAKAHGLLPLRHDESGAVRIAVSDPFDTGPLDDLRLLFDGAEIAAELAGVRVIETAINQVYDRGPGSAAEFAEEAATDLDTLADEISHQVPQDLIESADEAPIIKLVNSLLQQAVKERASDIHIEPFEQQIRVRFRIDDLLYEPIRPLPRSLQSSITSRIKIMGDSISQRSACPRTAAYDLRSRGGTMTCACPRCRSATASGW